MRCLCFTGYGTVFVFVGSQSRDLVTLLFYSNDVLVIITWRESGAAGDKTIVRGGRTPAFCCSGERATALPLDLPPTAASFQLGSNLR